MPFSALTEHRFARLRGLKEVNEYTAIALFLLVETPYCLRCFTLERVCTPLCLKFEPCA